MKFLLLFGFFIIGLEALGSVSGVGAGKDKCYSNMANFPCKITKPTQVAKNVTELTIGDIQVVIGLGDGSVTGAGVLSRQDPSGEIDKENPEASSLMGGDPKYITLPNLMLKYNKNLTGYSTSNDKGFNFAVKGSMTAGLKEQANLMFQQTKGHEKDWKLINILTGHIDFCNLSCRKGFKASQMVENIISVVREIKAKMPKTFVSILPPFDTLTPMFYYEKFKSENPKCKTIMPMACPCSFDDKMKLTTRELRVKQNEFYQLLVSAVEDGDFDAEDFAVVINGLGLSFNTNFTLNFYAPNCLHTSLFAQQQFAVAYFNMLLTNVHEKEPVLNLPTKLQCPEDMKSPYLKTKQNSMSGQRAMKYESSFIFDSSKVKCVNP